MNQILEGALDYAARGWRVVPLKARAKRPLISNWNLRASADPKIIQEWFRRWPTCNVGVLLGPDSGIIDVECDSKKAEYNLLDLFGSTPQVPTFKANRGKHRLFLWTDNIPHATTSVFNCQDIEFRVGGYISQGIVVDNNHSDKAAQSVFPPSIHATGAVYAWSKHPNEFPLMELPEYVLNALANSRAFIGNGSPNGQPGPAPKPTVPTAPTVTTAPTAPTVPTGSPVSIGGSAVQGTPSNTDPLYSVRKKPYKAHRCVLKAGVQVQIDMNATWDTYLLLEDPTGKVVAQNDDKGGQGPERLSSRITFTPATPGNYTIIASGYRIEDVGPYTISISTPPAGNSALDVLNRMAGREVYGRDYGFEPVGDDEYLPLRAEY